MVKDTVLLRSIATVPAPDLSDRNSGAGASAEVLLSTLAFVVAEVYRNASGSVHSASVSVPLKLVPVNLIVVLGHPVVGDTDVRCHADAAWALAKNTSTPSMLATRLSRPVSRRLRPRGSAVVPCMASLRLRIRVSSWNTMN